MNLLTGFFIVVAMFMFGALAISFLDNLGFPLISALAYNGFY